MKLFGTIKRLFHKHEYVGVRDDHKVYHIGGTWGDCINQQSVIRKNGEYRGIEVHGWKTPRPRKGDVLHQPMASGRTAELVFSKVEYCTDPADMFFATALCIGYVSEPAP